MGLPDHIVKHGLGEEPAVRLQMSSPVAPSLFHLSQEGHHEERRFQTCLGVWSDFRCGEVGIEAEAGKVALVTCGAGNPGDRLGNCGLCI